MRILRVFLVAVAAVLSAACDQIEWTAADTTYVPVYEIYDISDADDILGLASIDIYQEKPLAIVHTNMSVLYAYEMLDYVDATDSEAYDISFRIEERDSSTNEITSSNSYSIFGTKQMGFVYIQIVDNLSDSDEIYFDSDAEITIDYRLN
ncbi:MAG: hypothetical protein R3Y68_03330 [Rikenellaceae bacterium]